MLTVSQNERPYTQVLLVNNKVAFSLLQVSIGMLGIITEVTIPIERSYLLRETLTTHTLERCLLDLDALMRSGEHAKMWIELFSEKCAVFAANRTTETAVRDNPNWTRKNIEVAGTFFSKSLSLSPSY